MQNDLSRRDVEDLTEQEQAVLRDAGFALGDVYLDLERYPEALRAYQSAANHDAFRPEALDAYLQMADITVAWTARPRPARRWNRPASPCGGFRRNVHFEQATNFNRKQWGELLDRLCSL